MTCSLDLQSHFNDERVIVFADQVRVFSGHVTTEPSTGLAKHLSIPSHGSYLHLRIEVPNTASQLEQTFDLRRGRYLGLSRNHSTKQLVIEQQAATFFYD